VLPQPGKAPRRVTNVRDDKAMTGFWRESLEKRRCLVPASAFCEPDGHVKPATWNWFALKGDECGGTHLPLSPFSVSCDGGVAWSTEKAKSWLSAALRGAQVGAPLWRY
jgi:hypothetical protein